ncbi:MAG: TonB-dependent receptor [Xanthomonadales bacterium]|nr:TonB-dependent receptor [Xanthomonadales bacterium]
MKGLPVLLTPWILLTGGLLPVEPAVGQESEAVEEVVVTGSRIRRDPLSQSTAVVDLDRQTLNRTGITNLGDILQDLPFAGSAPNSEFNIPGNAGFPQDGSGIGAGSVQLSLRNLGSKRTLVLVDGKRWIAGSSASGVPSTVDLNSLPDNVIKRIEMLPDGVSAIYGSDAIGGVANIITHDDFSGLRLDAHAGQYLSTEDGQSERISALWGAGGDTTHVVLSLSHTEEKAVTTSDRRRSAYPNPDATSCDVPNSFCSSFTPQGRFVLGPNFGFTDVTLNNGVLNDGAGNIPAFDPSDPFSGDFHPFTNADRYNYNERGFNLLRTPVERTNVYGSLSHDFSDSLRLVARASYTRRESETTGAPEPLCLGNDCGNRFSQNVLISALNPFNPFGVDLSVANGNLEFFGRRPIESGQRLFFQEVDSLFFSATLEGSLEAWGRPLYWDVSAGYGDNSGDQRKENSHNIVNILLALGDPTVCAQVPGCVPLNFFGGQGPDGQGSFTREMIDFITYTQRDSSEQTLADLSLNVTGDLAELPAGKLAFAAGLEYRDYEGEYRADPIAERGETAGIPSTSTFGGYDVTELYAELNIPLLSASQTLEASIAGRLSDYSTSGSEPTYKASLLWRPRDDVSLRGSVSTGFRAPGIGELFGGAAREDFAFVDPCADYTAILGSAAGGRDTPQSGLIQANCAALGVPPGLAQLNPQLTATSSGNADLTAETSDAWSFGLVYSPNWVDRLEWVESLTLSADVYDLTIDDAVQGGRPGDIITACVNTLDPDTCASAPRAGSGRLGLVNNQLQNIGRIETSGADLSLALSLPSSALGDFDLSVTATYLDQYREITAQPDGGVAVNDLTGVHTDETFQRAFPEWRVVTGINWQRNRWSASVMLRFIDNMLNDDRSLTIDSALFTDLQVNYQVPLSDDRVLLSVGFNNLFSEDAPVCFPCAANGLSSVAHDLPGRIGYLRVTYDMAP